MPDTYNFSLGDSRAEMIGRMRRAMEKALAEAWAKRNPATSLPSPDAALTLALDRREGKRIARRTAQGRRGLPEPAGQRHEAPGRPDGDLRPDPGKGAARPAAVASRPVGPIRRITHIFIPGCRRRRSPVRGAARSTRCCIPTVRPRSISLPDGSGRHAFAESLDEHNRNVTKLRQLEQSAAPAVTK